VAARAIVVWDRDDPPLQLSDRVLCWRSFTEAGAISSVPRYLESHAERIRKKYLAFIHDLGERSIAGKRVIDHLDLGDGFSLWWMTHLAEKSPFKSRRIYDCLRLLALEEMLTQLRPVSVTLVSADGALAEAIARLCGNLQLSFRVERPGNRQRRWTVRRVYEALPFPLKALISLRQVVLHWPLRRIKHPNWFPGKDSIFFCSYFIHLDPVLCEQGSFFSRQWESLPGTLRAGGVRTNWVQLFLFSAVVPKVGTGIAWLRQFNADALNQGYQSFLESYLTVMTVLRALKNWLWLNTVAWKLRNIQSAFRVTQSAVWLWPLLRDDWFTSLRGPTALTNCLWLELFDRCLADVPAQQTGLYLCENQAWEKAFLRAWRKHGHGRLIGVQHATVPFWHLYYFDDPRSLQAESDCAMPLPDKLAVNGTAARRAFVDAGFPAERLVEVEALRYLNLSPLATNNAHKPPRTPPEGPHGTRVLVLGDMIPGAMHEFLVLVSRAVKLLPAGYEFTFKPHPGFRADLTDYPDFVADETAESLHKILDGYDVAIAANSTSASVDAFVAGLPVIINLSGNDLNLGPLRGQAGVCFVTTPEELADALGSIRTGSIPRVACGEFFFLEAGLPRWRALLPMLGSNTDDAP
jgi:surface carbohydrate biosynthesis protein (TIGR04326 family)